MIALAFVTLGEASPWVREPWGSYLKLGASRFMAAEHGSTHVVAYGELGLPARLGLTVSVPWVESAAEDRWFTYQNRDFGDAEFALTRELLPGPWALSASLGARVPLYPDRTGEREASWGSLASRFPSPGDGTVDLDGRIELGRGLRIGGWGGWVEASAGYRHRLGDPVDGLVGGLRAGVVPRRGEADAGWMGVEVQVDVRSVSEWEAGHVPGAVHFEWDAVLDSGLLRSPDEIAELLADVGLDEPDEPVITYCAGGIRAGQTFFVLELMGFGAVQDYVGSWTAWSASGGAVAVP